MIRSLPWPLAVIDFEASSLEPSGYPIEVGLALWDAPGEPIRSWSALIQPTTDWARQGHWSQQSAKVHGLRGRDLMAAGWRPDRIAPGLNRVLGPGRTVWCDGGPYDGQWMRGLFRAGGVDPVFMLDDWHRLAALMGKTSRERALDWLERVRATHRARSDAEQLLLAMAHALGIEAGCVEDPDLLEV